MAKQMAPLLNDWIVMTQRKQDGGSEVDECVTSTIHWAHVQKLIITTRREAMVCVSFQQWMGNTEYRKTSPICDFLDVCSAVFPSEPAEHCTPKEQIASHAT
jgi:hypothetical protein